MKKFNLLVTAIILTFTFISSGLAQPEKVVDFSPVKNKNYDADLAQKTGADEYGKRKFVLLKVVKLKNLKKEEIYKKLKESIGENNKEIGITALFLQLIDTFEVLEREKVVLSRFGFYDSDKTVQMFLIEKDSLLRVHKILNKNPLIKSGVLSMESNEIYGSAAFMLIPETNEKLVKMKETYFVQKLADLEKN